MSQDHEHERVQIADLEDAVACIDSALRGPVLWHESQAMLYQAQWNIKALAKRCREWSER